MHTPQAGCETVYHDYYDNVEDGPQFRLYSRICPLSATLGLYRSTALCDAHRLLAIPPVGRCQLSLTSLRATTDDTHERVTASALVEIIKRFSGLSGVVRVSESIGRERRTSLGGSTLRRTRLLPVEDIMTDMCEDDNSAAQLYESVETGTRQSVYDLAIGARHAKLDKSPEDGPEDAVRFNGDLYVPVTPDQLSR